MLKLHLGCGAAVKEGWTNIDIENHPGVVVHDLTKPLNFIASGTVDYIFSEHFIEHITRPQGLALLKECYRMLKPGGVVRVTCPDLDTLIDDYKVEKIDRWRDGWLPKTPCQMVNEGMRLWGHQFLYNVRELDLIFKQAKFWDIEFCKWRESKHEELKNAEFRHDCGEIFAEATK